MAESSNSITEKVRDWLKSQGYPLEMSVARAFRRVDANVQQSSYYLDPETDKSREIDVRAKWYRFHETMWGQIDLQVFFLIACKSQQKNPWILFSSEPKKKNAFVRLPASPHGRMLLDWFRADKTKSIIDISDHVSYGITQAFTSGKDLPYEAVMSAAKAAVAEIVYHNRLHELYKDKFDKDFEISLDSVIAIPIVVTDAPLFDCYLTEDDSLILDKIESGILEWHYLLDDNASHFGTPVYICSDQSLDDLANYAKNLESQLYEFLPTFLNKIRERLKNNEKGT